MVNMLDVVTLFARAGGGGSSSESSAAAGLFFLPLLVSAGVAGIVRHQAKSKAIGFIVGIVAGLLVSLLFLIGGVLFFVLAIIVSIAGSASGAFADPIGRFRKNSKAAKAAAQQAAMADSMWNEQLIIDYANQVFNRFQYDWQNMDLPSIQQYTTERYAKHIGLMLYAMQQMGRVNKMSNIVISESILTQAHDDADNTNDRVGVAFLAQARDELIESETGKVIRRGASSFGEQWNFVRKDNSWLLDSIDQATEDSLQLITSMRQFAEQNQMYYSPDWGNLLIPTKGRLFKVDSDDVDINNHIIGFWTGNLLVQLYTYRVRRESNRNSVVSYDNYIVGQVSLPKSYGGIFIERGDSTSRRRITAPSGYKKVTLEWGDFNKRYNVYATDENQVTSFELLNPSFMAWLYDNNLKVDIEVVGNVVYLYAKVSDNENRYGEMMEILRRSHKELKM